MRTIPRDYRRELNAFVDELFLRAEGRKWTWTELARRAGLVPVTVARLGRRETRLPELLTVWKIARAVGLRVSLQQLKKQIKKVA